MSAGTTHPVDLASRWRLGSLTVTPDDLVVELVADDGERRTLRPLPCMLAVLALPPPRHDGRELGR